MRQKITQYLFWSIIVFVVVGLSYTYWKGKQQDQSYNREFQQYVEALQFIQQKQGEQAIQILKQLSNKYPDRYNISRYLGLSYALAGDFKRASFYYQKAIDQRPFLQVDPIFTLQFGEILYFNGEYAKARAYLERSKQLPGTESYHSRINELLTFIYQQTK